MALVRERPAPGVPRPFSFPPFTRERLPNGLTVISCHVPGRRLVSASLLLDAGIVHEDPAKAGSALLTARALTEGTERYDATAFVDAAERLGADLRAHADWDAMAIDVRVPVARLSEALALLAEAAIRPSFPEDEVERLRLERLNDIKQEMANPGSRAMIAFTPSIYVPGSTYARPGGGTAATVGALQRDDIAGHYQRYASPRSATLIVAGDLSAVDVSVTAAELFGGWSAPEAERAEPRIEDGVEETSILVVDRPGSVQSNLVMGHTGLARTAPEFFRARLLIEALGGSFNSRINLKLREEKGYTYGAHASIDFRRWAGPFIAAAPVQTGVTREAVEDMLGEIRLMRDAGPTQEELDAARDYLVGVFPLRFETPDAIASGISALVTYGHPDDWFDTYAREMEAVTLAAVAETAQRFLRPERTSIVVVGDAAGIAGPLEAAALGPVRVISDEEMA